MGLYVKNSTIKYMYMIVKKFWKISIFQVELIRPYVKTIIFL